MAAAVLKQQVGSRTEHNPDWKIESAGTWAVVDQPATPEAVAVMQERGLDISQHRSRPIDRALLNEAAVVLVMTRHHREALRVEFPEFAARIYLISELIGRQFEIPDPFGGSLDDYRQCAADLDDIFKRGLSHLAELGDHLQMRDMTEGTSNMFKQQLLKKIEDRSAVLGIVGLGYVGLPLAVEFAKAGFKVIGVDVDPNKVQTINAGRSYIPDVTTDVVAALRAQNKLTAVTGSAALGEADAVIICVPTPLRKTRDPDMSYVIDAAEKIAAVAQAGMLIVLESTTYPGTTEEILQPPLEAKGFKIGQDVFLAFSPERIDPGNAQYGVHNTPKVVGGATPECTEVVQALYRTAIESVVPVSSMRAAEMVKLLENTFRAVNIGLVNEMALMCDKLGIDVWEVIEAASSKPYGFMKFTPGPGIGGHCIPIDPLYLSWKLKSLNYTARFIEVADQINMSMPQHVVTLIQDALNEESKALKGSQVLILGAAYKKDIDDLRESPALDVMVTLLERGANVTYHDPYAPVVRLDGLTLHSISELSPDVLAQADCVVVITDHSAYDWQMISQHARLIVDTRNALKVAINGRARVVTL